MTKLMLVLSFKQCKSNISVYYFIDEKTRELIIAIVYVYDVYFMSLEYYQLFLKSKQKFMIK